MKKSINILVWVPLLGFVLAYINLIINRENGWIFKSSFKLLAINATYNGMFMGLVVMHYLT